MIPFRVFSVFTLFTFPLTTALTRFKFHKENIQKQLQMTDADSIQRASELVNSILFARGYFSPDAEQDTLLFSSINNDELQTPEQVHANDRLVLNTMYALLQELDHTKTEKQYLADQLADKTEIIKHYETSNRELNLQTTQLHREISQRGNETTLLKQSIKNLKSEKLLQERHLQTERNVNNALKTKFDVEMKKKAIQIEKLQDRLLSKRHKYQSIIERNNHSISEPTQSHTSISDSKLAIDDEMEVMMVNLSDLITSLTFQNDTGLKLVNFIQTYLTLLTDHSLRRLTGKPTVALPPTPKFFFDNMASSTSSTTSEVLTHSISMDAVQPLIIDVLEKLYDVVNSDLSGSTAMSHDDGKVGQLQKEIAMLKKNLEVAMETNEKWSKRFNKK